MHLNKFTQFIVLFLMGCVTSVTHTQVPEQHISDARVMRSPLIRFWGDEEKGQYRERLNLADWLQQRTQQLDKDETTLVINFLALFGGGEDGSFAAGIITGWTRHGDRPEFDVITGVSAGALAAPFIFLGPEYDEMLFDMYANLGHEDIYRTQIFSGPFGGSAIIDTRPLKNLISKYVTTEILDQVAI